MASANLTYDGTEIPNPLTPMALLSPHEAHLREIGIYVIVGVFGAYVWELVSNLGHDYKLVTQHRIGISTVVYFFSRLWTFLFFFASIIFSASPIHRCNLVFILGGAACTLAIASSSLLFFLRAWAIFDRNRVLIFFLFCLWLGVLGTGILIPLSISAQNVGPTPYCMTKSASFALGGVIVAIWVHDTAVFAAISWRLFRNSDVDDGFRGTMSAFITGKHLPRFSQALFKDGQQYYFLAVTCHTCLLALVFNPHLQASYRILFAEVNVVVTNTLACYVFRNIKLGYTTPVATTSEMISQRVTSIQLASGSGNATGPAGATRAHRPSIQARPSIQVQIGKPAVPTDDTGPSESETQEKADAIAV